MINVCCYVQLPLMMYVHMNSIFHEYIFAYLVLMDLVVHTFVFSPITLKSSTFYYILSFFKILVISNFDDENIYI